MSDYHQLSPEARAAFNAYDLMCQRTGRGPRTKAQARTLAEKHNAPVADVLAFCGFANIDASPPARRIGEFLHGRKKK